MKRDEFEFLTARRKKLFCSPVVQQWISSSGWQQCEQTVAWVTVVS